MLKAELIAYRPMEATDENYIFVQWLKFLRLGNDFFRLIPRDLYTEKYRPIIRKILDHSTVKMACLQEAPDVIIGFSVSGGDRLHWIYVKEDWRKIGIAKDLLPSPFASYSHITIEGLQILQKKYKSGEIVFNPFF